MIKSCILFSIASMMIVTNLFAQAEEQDRPRNTFYEPKAIAEREPVELPYIREVDVLWSKRVWQRIDVRQKLNQPLYFPETPSGDYRSLMQVLEDAIRAGEIRAYGVDDENFREDPLDPERLFDDLSRIETFVVEGEEVTEVIDFDPSEVYVFRIMEEWFIDARRGQLDVRIIGLSPARLVTDEDTGELTNIQDPLFWIPFEEARPAFANAPVYNRRNDAPNMSFDDYFIRRFFDATIYREERPDNRVILEYIDDPVEQLLEAERIKEEIRNKELDIWHY